MGWPSDINEPLTIGRLKLFLEEWEKSWGEGDKQFLGEFDKQLVTCSGIDQGYCPAGVSTAYCDLMFFAIKEKK